MMLGCHSCRHVQNIGTCGFEACQDADGFDVTAHYSQDLPEGEYAIKQPTAGGPIAAVARVKISSEHASLICEL